MRLYSVHQRPFENVRHAAIALAVVQEHQNHIGILFTDEGADEVRLGHLAWHLELRTSQPKNCYLWVDPPIPARRARQVAARCRQILRANDKGIPYAFSPPNDCFDDETGDFLLGATRKGLTCATFVLAVFDTAGIQLAKYDSWPQQRPGDAEWRQSIIEQLQNSSADAEHLAFIREETRAIRYRPEEVAGCAASDHLPCEFAIAESLSLEILNQLRRHGKALRDT
jgi:hypothetical protein